MELPEARIPVLAPMVRGSQGEYEKLLGDLARRAFRAPRIDGECGELSEAIRLPEDFKHTIECASTVDRQAPNIRVRVADSLETASSSQRASLPSRSRAQMAERRFQNFSQGAR